MFGYVFKRKRKLKYHISRIKSFLPLTSFSPHFLIICVSHEKAFLQLFE
eukprot:UN20893